VGVWAGIVLLALSQAACSSRSGDEEAAAAKRPNIVYILVDDLGYGDLGALGGEIPTPNLDELAHKGMLLTSFYAHMTCSPTRAMVMSGVQRKKGRQITAGAFGILGFYNNGNGDGCILGTVGYLALSTTPITSHAAAGDWLNIGRWWIKCWHNTIGIIADAKYTAAFSKTTNVSYHYNPNAPALIRPFSSAANCRLLSLANSSTSIPGAG
jgi:hypothetical protein